MLAREQLLRFSSRVLFLLSFAAYLSAQDVVNYSIGTCRSMPSDTTFLKSPDPSDVDGVCGTNLLPCPTARATVSVTRVAGIGSGSGAINSDGTLVNTNDYVENGVVSKDACLRINLFACVQAGTSLTVSFNGHSLINGSVSIPYASSSECGYLNKDWELRVPIEYVRFAKRNSGSLPTPGINTITIEPSNRYAPDICDDCSLYYNVTSLSFEAMAPIVLVHGWISGPWWWGPPQTAPVNFDDYCGIRTDEISHSQVASEYDMNFVQVLKDSRAPYECGRIQIDQNAMIEIGGQTLKSGLLGGPNQQLGLRQILDEFGTKHVHLIAHSKGGLWARDYLMKAPDPDATKEVAVYSLITLDTPHEGSFLADIVTYARQLPMSTFGIPLVQNYRAWAGFFSHGWQGTSDMTVQSMQVRNATAQFPPFFVVDRIRYPARYRSISSDADVNGDGKLNRRSSPPCSEWNSESIISGDCDEVFPYTGFRRYVLPQMYQDLRNYREARYAWRTGFGRWIPQTPLLLPNPSPQNDTAVTVTSASHPPFNSIPNPYNGLSYWKHNHKTVGASDVARAVLGEIRKAQPMRQAE